MCLMKNNRNTGANMKREFEFVLTVKAYGEDSKDAFYDLLLDLKVDPRAALDSRLMEDIIYRSLDGDDDDDDEDDDDISRLVSMVDWGTNDTTQA